MFYRHADGDLSDEIRNKERDFDKQHISSGKF